MNLWAVLLTGLFAGGASCAAVQGGLLAGVVARRPQASAEPTSSAPRSSDGRKKASSGGAGRKKPPAGPRRAAPPVQPADHLADLAPVSWFLGGKLISHTLLGALLGSLGAAVQISSRTRALLQITAGLVMIVLAANLFGVAGLARFVPQPPAVLARLVRRRSRSSAATAPLVLGMATVLIPCGVTLSVEVLAITSGSPLAGASVMAVFVVGTSPLFALLGYVARRSATVLQGRLGKFAAVAVLVMGLVSVNTGLVLAGSPVNANSVLASVRPSGSSAPAENTAQPPAAAVIRDGVQEIRIRALDTAYVPNLQLAKAGLPTKLIIETRNTQGCTRFFVIPSTGVQTPLPQDGETVVDLGVLQAGRLDYTCGMGMYGGAIEVV